MRIISKRIISIFFIFFIFLNSFGEDFTIPSGSFALSRLYTGIAVALPGIVQFDPSPVVVVIERGFFTPSGGFVEISGCFASGTAYWADHLTRVIVEIKKISCPMGGRIYEVEVLGYLYDTNGVLGLKPSRYEERVKEIWGLRIIAPVAIVEQYREVYLFLRTPVKLVYREKPSFKWKTPLTYPDENKNMPP